jgi:Flp pilus assembly protein CpaB
MFHPEIRLLQENAVRRCRGEVLRGYRIGVAAGAVLALVGCYTYRPVPTAEPVSGTRISAQLTGTGSRDLAAQIGPDVLHVEGKVLHADSAGLDLEVREIESYRGIRSDWNGEQVRLPRAAVAGIQERKLSPGGTGIMSGAIVAGLYAVYRILGGPGLFEGNPGQSAGGGR